MGAASRVENLHSDKLISWEQMAHVNYGLARDQQNRNAWYEGFCEKINKKNRKKFTKSNTHTRSKVCLEFCYITFSNIHLEKDQYAAFFVIHCWYSVGLGKEFVIQGPILKRSIDG